MVYQWMQSIQKLALRGRCLLCNQPLSQNQFICQHCETSLALVASPCPQCGENLPPGAPVKQACERCQRHPPVFDHCVAPLVYQKDIRLLHHKFKFHRDLTAGRALAHLMARQLQKRQEPLPEVLIPIPLHPKRMRQRGFDQTHELSKDLGRLLQLPTAPAVLERVVHTQPQSTLTSEERQRNLRNAFRLRAPLHYRHIALVDDIMTTGATLSAVASLCRQAGVQLIEVWAVSRTLAD